MDEATIFCIGIIAFGMLFIAILYLISSKYLKGDFTKVPTQDNTNFADSDDDEENEDQKYKVSPFEMYSEDSASKKISNYGFNSTFSADASLKATLEYKSKSQCLLGNIVTLTKLDLKCVSAPSKIRFHLKLVPKNKFSRKTQWKSVSSRILALTFTMGKVTHENLKSYKLCVRVYGSQSTLSLSQCYGECYINLKSLLEGDKCYEFSKKILPKVKQNSGSLFSDSEPDTDVEQSEYLVQINDDVDERIEEIEENTENNTNTESSEPIVIEEPHPERSADENETENEQQNTETPASSETVETTEPKRKKTLMKKISFGTKKK